MTISLTEVLGSKSTERTLSPEELTAFIPTLAKIDNIRISVVTSVGHSELCIPTTFDWFRAIWSIDSEVLTNIIIITTLNKFPGCIPDKLWMQVTVGRGEQGE